MPRLTANNIDITYELSGPPSGPPIVIIQGYTSQMTSWPDEFHEALASAGLRVIRFDNRDIGLGHKHDGIMPDLRAVAAAIKEGTTPPVPYTLNDMADDVVAMLDALNIKSAHIAGASMGGMIAQLVAIRHPERTRSLISLMSTTSDPSLPRSDTAAQEALTQKPPAEDKDSVADHAVKTRLVIASPGYPEDQAKVRARFAQNYDRSYYPQGGLRQWAAIMATPPRTEQLKKLNVRTLVLHGEADILIKPEAGRHTAECIKGAELKLIKGWGHNMPIAAVPDITGPMIDFIQRVEAGRTRSGSD
ncbi:MAG: alpha/beta hydrolase [Alphaproteobacteria bacterium]|nr:alpha/beta hydrolase [Alphaproteobacteria bacterium]